MASSTLIESFMKDVITNYNTIRGKEKNDGDSKFWDIVVISALDESQKKAYELQIKEKRKRYELPLQVPFHVFCDPPDQKIGCGGSTMYVLEQLYNIYETSFQEMCILFIPAGGFSQRLPNWTVLGKLFCPVPLPVSPMYQMIDLILAVYQPFVTRMAPGVFLASSDAIVSYHLSHDDFWTFTKPGFTALAHPSSISVGKDHGVFVLPKSEIQTSGTFMSNCIQVLQKPSEQLMKDRQAVIRDENSRNQEIVYSDSVFYFDSTIAMKLINLHRKVKPLKFEISSYGDFLQPLGIASNPNYIQWEDVEEKHVKMQLFELLYGTPLNILVLNNSVFHHLGTMKEYLANYCYPSIFTVNFPFCRTVFSFAGSIESMEGTLLHSLIHPQSNIPPSTIVEYCSFGVPIHFGENSIISHCKLHTTNLDVPIQLPSNILIHTLAVHGGYVTVFFGTNDDIKRSCPIGECENLFFMGKQLDLLLKAFSILCFNSGSKTVSLWEAKIFPFALTMDESFTMAIRIINIISKLNYLDPPTEHFDCINSKSMQNIILEKDVENMLEFKENLFTAIKNL